jgi:hypothetical protein
MGFFPGQLKAKDFVERVTFHNDDNGFLLP